MLHLSSLLTIALAGGIAIGVLADPPATLVLTLLLSAAWATSLLTYLRGYRRAQLASISVLACGAGWVLGAHTVAGAMHPPLRHTFDERIGEEPVVIEGRLREDGVLTTNGVVLRMDVERVNVNGAFEPTAGGLSIGVGGTPALEQVAQWRRGRLIRAPALLRRPARYLNRGLADQERALARRGIALVGTIKSASLIDVRARGRWWEEAAAAVRASTREALKRHVAPLAERSAAIAAAILIGDRAGLTPDLERRLQEAGTYHVIAISGGNIAILAGGLLLAFGVLGIRGRIGAASVIGALAAYAVIASSGASVMRATLMAVVYLAVRLIDHRTAAENALSVTAAMVLLATPLAIVDVGFWLTFGATVALMIGAARHAKDTKHTKHTKQTKDTKDSFLHLRRLRDASAIRGLTAVVIATVYVEIALVPVAAFVFQRVTVAGLALNLAALPAMTAVQVAAMGVVAFDAIGISIAAGWVARAVYVGTIVLTESARLLDYAPWLTWRVPSPHVVVIAIYYGAMAIAVVGVFRHWSRTAIPLASGVACVLFLWIVSAPVAHIRARGDGRLHLSLFDVGQGDSMLVTFPNGRTLLVDSGGVSLRGEFDIGDRVIGPTIRAANRVALDYLAITHADPDHIGGARTVVRDFTPAEIWWGVPVANHEAAAIVRHEGDQRRIPWRTLQRGDRLDIGGVELRVHHPPPPDWERQRVRNDDSLVIELRFGDVSMLLTGDVGRVVEQQLLPTLDLLPTVVLKVAHHGSATSSTSEFLERVRPAVAVIGVGRGNMYGHPVRAVIDRLQDAGAEIFRTDLDGQIEVITDGRAVTTQTFTGRRSHIGGRQ